MKRSMDMKIDRKICFYCGTCANICPQDAVELLDNGEAEVNEDACTDCSLCSKACPVGAIEVV
jgi:ferredoxin